MRKKTKILLQTLVFVLLPAFVIRPVIVSVHNGLALTDVQHEGNSFSAALFAPHSVFHHLSRETPPDLSALIPRYTRMNSPSFLGSRLNLVSNPYNPFHKNFLVLRI